MVAAGSISFDIEFSLPSIDRAIANVRQRIASESIKLKVEVDPGSTSIPRPDTSAFSAAQQSIKQILSQIGSQKVSPQIDLDAAAIARSIAQIEAQIEQIKLQRIKIEADISNAKISIRQVDEQLAALKDQKIKLEADPTSSQQDIKKLADQIERLENKRIKLDANTQQADAKVRRLDGQLDDLDNQRNVLINIDVDQERIRAAGSKASGILTSIFQGVGQRVGAVLTNALSTAAQAPVKGIGGAIKTFASFESALVGFNAKAQASEETLEALRQEAERVGIETSKTPREVVQLATSFIQLGASAEQAVDQVAGTVAAIESTGFEVERTAKVVQQASTIFGESADVFADKISVLANTTAITSAAQIEQALGKAGGSFTRLEQPIDSLLATFATFRDVGLGPERAATATRNAIERLAGTTDVAKNALKELNVSLFEDGAPKDFILTLQELKASLAGFNQEQQTDLLRDIFGESGGDISLLLAQVDEVGSAIDENSGKLSQSLARLAEPSGEALASQERLNAGIDKSITLLAGSFETLQTRIGSALAPAIEPLIRGVQGIVDEVLALDSLFDPLQQASTEFGEALAANPEIVRSLGVAIGEVVGLIATGLTQQLQSFTAALQENPEIVQDIATKIVETAQGIGSIISLAVDLGAAFGSIALTALENLPTVIEGVRAVVTPLLPVAIALGQTVAEIGGVILPPLVGILQAVSAVLSPLTQNTTALKIALETAGIAFIAFNAAAGLTAIKTAIAAMGGLAAVIPAVTASLGAATAGLGAFATSIAVAIPPLAVLAAAIVAVNVGVFIRDLKVANDTLQALAGGTSQVAQQGIDFANDLKNAREQINSAIADGNGLTDEQIEKNKELIRLSKEQVEAIQSQREQVSNLDPKNESQRNAQQNLLADLSISEEALQKQIDQAEAALKNAQPQVAITPTIDTQGATQAGEDLGDQIVANEQQTQDEIDKIRQEGIDKFEQAQSQSLQRLEQAQQESILKIKQQQASGDITAEDADAQIAAIEANVGEEIAIRRQGLAEIDRLRTEGTLTEEEAASRSAAIQAEITALQIQSADAQIAAQERARAAFEAAQQAALQNIQSSQQQRVIGVRRQQASGSITAEDANAQIAEIEANNQAEIDLKRQAIAEIQRLESEKVLSAREAADQIADIEIELGDLTLQQIEAEIAAQDRAKAAAIDKLNSQLEAAQQLQEVGNLELSLAGESLSQELSLLESRNQLVAAQAELEQTVLQGRLASAEAAGDATAVIRLQAQLQQQQISTVQQEFQSRREQLALSQEQLQLDQQRQVAATEIAALEADIALQQARVEGKSADIVSSLETIRDLRAEQVDAARDAAANQDRINAAALAELSIQEQIALEKQKQNAIAEQGLAIEESRGSIILDALRSQSNIRQQSPEERAEQQTEALDTLSGFRESFRGAQQAGLFEGQGEDFTAALRQVEQALRQGNDRNLIQLAQENIDNALFSDLFDAIGRSDITNLVEADQQLSLGQQLKEANVGIEARLDRLIEATLSQNRGIEIGQVVTASNTGRVLEELNSQAIAGANL